jgi:alanine dehydrogenase
MNKPTTIGFPRMRKEAGEKRVFLPDFIHFLADLGATIFIEEGYGSRTGYDFEDYALADDRVRLCSRAEAFAQEVVFILRSPTLDEIGAMRPGTTLVSMLHYPTRPIRVQTLVENGIKGVSLDSIVNDSNVRLVENMKAVAWNGLEAAFGVLEQRWLGLRAPHGGPIRVLILGAGMVGKHAVEASTKLGNIERNAQHMQEAGPGAVAWTIGRNVSPNPATMETLLRQADILVDATQRRDASRPVIPNQWIAWLPEHAVLCDLAVDPYTLDADPPVVRGIEGIPQGNLDKYVFHPEDPEWDRRVPSSVPSGHRRIAVSCYSWPGIHPEASMHHYGLQLRPLVTALLENGYDGLSLEGDYFERAMTRATLQHWLETEQRDRQSAA